MTRLSRPPEPECKSFKPVLMHSNILERHDLNRLAVSCSRNAARIIRAESEVSDLNPIRDRDRIEEINRYIILQTLIAAESVNNLGIKLSYTEKETTNEKNQKEKEV